MNNLTAVYYAAYARVSSDEQREGESVESQLQRIQRWVDAQTIPFVCVAELKEDFTGYEWERPEMDIVRELAKNGKITAVIVAKRDRFARGEDTSLILEKMLSKMGVRLFSVQEGEFTPGAKNRILSAVERAQSEEIAESLKENMRNMRYHYIENGAFQSQGIAKYGYRKEGKKAQSRLVIDEEEAEIVRLIFDLFIQRRSYNEIADLLNERGISRPAISKGLNRPSNTTGWNRVGVRNLIDDARYYSGEYVAYKRATRQELKDKTVVIPVPAIIDCDTYDKVMFIRDTLRKQPIYTDYDLFTLTRRLSCQCGYNYSQQKTMRKNSLYRYYRCNATNEKYNRNNAVCSIRSIPADKIESAVWCFVKGLLLNPKAVIARQQQQQAQRQATIDNATAHVETIDELIAELGAEREQTLTLFRKRHITEDRLDADLAGIDRQLEKLSKERARWSGILDQYLITTESLASLESICTELRQNLDSADPERILRIYDRLKLRVNVVIEDDQTIVYISILDCDAGKVPVYDESGTARDYITIIKPFVFRIPLV